MQNTAPIPLSSLSLSKTPDALPPIESGWVFDPNQRFVENVVAKMEFHWGMQRGQLDLRSPLNAFLVRSDMLQLFHEEEWGILPEPDTFCRVVEWIEAQQSMPYGQRGLFTTDFPTGEYEYILYPSGEMDVPLYIHQENQPPVRVKSPYQELPRVKASVHPFFAIYSGMNSLGISPKHLPRSVMENLAAVNSTWCSIPSREFYHGLGWLPYRDEEEDDDMDDLYDDGDDDDDAMTSSSSAGPPSPLSPRQAWDHTVGLAAKDPDPVYQPAQLPDESRKGSESTGWWYYEQGSLFLS